MNVDQLISWLVSEKEAGKLTGLEEVKVVGVECRSYETYGVWDKLDIDVNVDKVGNTLLIGKT
jgi:hypothetical protein